MEDGITNVIWQPAIHGGYTADSLTLSTSFYVSLANSPLYTDSQLVESIGINSSLPGCMPHLNPSNFTVTPPFWVKRPGPLVRFEVFYNCSAASISSVITVNMQLAAYNSITFSWVKQTGTTRAAFDMGTTITIADMVSDGSVGFLYLPAVRMIYVPSFIDESTFYLWLREPGATQQIANVSIISCTWRSC